MNYQHLRKLLFTLPEELTHIMSLSAISLAESLQLSTLLAREVPDDPVEIMGLRFPNPVGLAAGLDKDANYIRGLAALGFGFIEVGTVTPLPQPGNPKPRLFRLPDQQAIINRLGFNNDGVSKLVSRIKASDLQGSLGINYGKSTSVDQGLAENRPGKSAAAMQRPLGINLGKNLQTPVERALDDYRAGMTAVYELASYLVVNISSPNTPGLRDLQAGDELQQLLAGLKETHATLARLHGRHVPLLIKVAPDMNDDELGRLCGQAKAFELDGMIVGNTTVDREVIAGHRYAAEAGGLSGAPLRAKADHALSVVVAEVKGQDTASRGEGSLDSAGADQGAAPRREGSLNSAGAGQGENKSVGSYGESQGQAALATNKRVDASAGKMAVIGVGGIMSGEDAARKIALGADLVQIYTGFIYNGPDLILDCVDAIRRGRSTS